MPVTRHVGRSTSRNILSLVETDEVGTQQRKKLAQTLPDTREPEGPNKGETVSSNHTLKSEQTNNKGELEIAKQQWRTLERPYSPPSHPDGGCAEGGP